MYPRRVLDLARLIEVERQFAGQHVACVVAHEHRSPGRVERRLYESLPSHGVGREPRLEHEVLLVEVEVHGGIVNACRLMDVDVKAVAGFHLERRLHARVGEHRRRRVALIRLAVLGYDGPDAGERRDLVFILLCVVVARNPVGRVVASHGKLRVLLLDDEVVELLLLRKLVAQSHAIVVHAEAYGDVSLGGRLTQVHGHLVVVVSDGGRFAPHRLPRLVEGRCAVVGLLKSVHEVGLVHALRGVLVLGELQSEVRRFAHRLPLVLHLVGGLPLGREREGHYHVAVGRCDGLRRGAHGQQRHGEK